MNKQKDDNQMTIGKRLAEARVRKGYTLDDLQKITKIQKKYLLAIEENNFDQLPGDFYVRAFVKQYADSVGLNGRELLNDYDANLPNTKSDDYVDKVSEDKLATRTAKNHADDRSAAVKKYIPIVSIAIVIVLIIAIIWIAAAKNSHNASQVHINSNNNSVSVSSSKASSSSSSQAKKTSQKPKSNSKAKHVNKKSKPAANTKIIKNSDTSFKIKSPTKHNEIEISSGDRDWVSVSANNSSLWQSAQEAGSKHVVKLPSNTKTVSINLGNAIKANIKVNGQKVDINTKNQVQQIKLNF